jgi:chromosome segregation ATPase
MFLFALQLTLECVHCPKGGVSFSSRIHELENRLAMQVSELKQWQKRAESEEEMRRQAGIKINELQRIIEEAQKDRERLGIDVQEWKLQAEQCQTRAMKYDQAMRKLLAYLQEVRPELDG